MNILVVEDDKVMAGFIAETLRDCGNKVTVVHEVSPVLAGRLDQLHDILILDLVVGSERGEDLLLGLRRLGCNMPILILSGISAVDRRIDLLKQGADDYLLKPFDRGELVARVNALYRRFLDIPNESCQHFTEASFYWDESKVLRGGQMISLTNKEQQFLRLLVLNRGKVVTTEAILKKVWNTSSAYQSNVVPSLVKRLRQKLDGDFADKLLQNIHGVGYLIDLS